jgi:hypothetical protein
LVPFVEYEHSVFLKTILIEDRPLGPLFSARVVTWSTHPVLVKPLVLRGVVALDGSLECTDLSLNEQLRQRQGRRGFREHGSK